MVEDKRIGLGWGGINWKEWDKSFYVFRPPPLTRIGWTSWSLKILSLETSKSSRKSKLPINGILSSMGTSIETSLFTSDYVATSLSSSPYSFPSKKSFLLFSLTLRANVWVGYIFQETKLEIFPQCIFLRNVVLGIVKVPTSLYKVRRTPTLEKALSKQCVTCFWVMPNLQEVGDLVNVPKGKQ
jgi:hypothetical protein